MGDRHLGGTSDCQHRDDQHEGEATHRGRANPGRCGETRDRGSTPPAVTGPIATTTVRTARAETRSQRSRACELVVAAQEAATPRVVNAQALAHHEVQ